MKTRQIIAMGGGGFSMEPDNLQLDRYVLAQVPKETPKICFIPTASGDADNYVERFYAAFRTLPCTPCHLSLFQPNFADLRSYVLEQDILYVGGGNTRNMLVLWKEWGLDRILEEAYEQGIVLCGLSAGSICWFEEGVTDPLNAPLYKLQGLGLLKGSHCPHYDGENKRRPAYHDMILRGDIQAGYAADDGAALHFKEGRLHGVVGSRMNAKAYVVERDGEAVIERTLQTTWLG
ncbi:MULTISPECIES: peptidase E [Paenibacillus]|uniref:Peptidase E n=1 Tax=Paenibacillus campinasensis TaxID=66347 RepID=A0A268EX14_9BACL|nr:MULTISPECIES: peptidase E [Paenibacillus]MUG68304.1 peptidase E [Paenibacillus campinasensis]PAD77657.1 peptidase E [Paenibacillus campinasensis]PAK49827.1 peptidase E [Paenibacillus sp. 7541]